MNDAALNSYVPHLPAFRIALAKLRAAGLTEIADLIQERITQTEEYVKREFSID